MFLKIDITTSLFSHVRNSDIAENDLNGNLLHKSGYYYNLHCAKNIFLQLFFFQIIFLLLRFNNITIKTESSNLINI